MDNDSISSTISQLRTELNALRERVAILENRVYFPSTIPTPGFVPNTTPGVINPPWTITCDTPAYSLTSQNNG